MSLVKLAVTLRCQVCGEVPYATMEEADKRAEKHTTVTGHTTSVEARYDGEAEAAR